MNAEAGEVAGFYGVLLSVSLVVILAAVLATRRRGLSKPVRTAMVAGSVIATYLLIQTAANVSGLFFSN